MSLFFTKLNYCHCYCTKVNVTNPKQLYKYLLKECKKLPNGPQEHYIFAIKQSFKQHINETDPERIKQMITKSYNDSKWIIDKGRNNLNKMFRVPLVTSEGPIGKENYWNAVFLYHSSPHVINRRILSVSQLYVLKVNFKHDVYRVKDILKYSELDSQVFRLNSIDSTNINESIINNIFDQYGNSFSYERTNLDEIRTSDNEIFISIRILFPRNSKSGKCVEFVIIDKENSNTTFLVISKETKNALCPLFPYDIELDKNNLLKICVDTETAEHKASEWLANSLFPKLMAWTEIRDPNKSIQKSLSLVSVEKYCNLYHELKMKYGDTIVKNWPENTDPLKFVYEDVAIATYLLLLWERSSKAKQKFVDLGCGNGLLVHILSEEGHDGYGIDVRPRKIWNFFGANTKLKVATIIPSTDYIFPDTDWIIGNHSDELTPWIPVIAARSSTDCKFFLLPCCSYEFNGKKYQRLNSSQSQYQEYLDYIKNISKTCGFITEIDRLRIPSTKRICLVGETRQNNDPNGIEKKITDLINKRCGITENKDTTKWIENYEARSSTEKVRNCTKLDKTLVGTIVKKVVDNLLSEENYIQISTEKHWNQGSTLHLSNLVKIVSSDELKQLKNECGGLQTLLKNHHYVFLVKNGTVQLRMPTIKTTTKKNIRKTECWFYKNHPDGCSLNANDCTYLHC